MQSAVQSHRIKQFAVALTVVIILLLGWRIYYATTFHINGTTPKTGSVSTLSPSITIRFSKPVSAQGLIVSSQPDIIGGTAISSNSLVLQFKTKLTINKTYHIAIKQISSTNGKQLQSKTITFKVKDIAYQQLTTGEQKQLLNNQAQAASTQPPAYLGNDGLLDKGLSTQEVEEYKQAVTKFITDQNQKFTGTAINTNSITSGPLDGSGVFSVTFSVSINSKNYNAKLAYTSPSQIQLYLTDPTTDQQVYDSGIVNSVE